MSYSWFHFLFAFIICINGVFSESASHEDSYSKHCSSVIPRYNITARNEGDSLPSLSTPYFTGGDRFRPADRYPAEHDVQKDLRLRLRPDHYQTTAAGVYSVEGFIYITFVYGSKDDPKLRFPMNGFWSEKSRKLCMVGSTSWNGTDLHAVLKLKFDDENPTIHTGVVSGSLESTASPAYFDPFLLFDFPTAVSDYNYSLVPKELGTGGAPQSWKDESLSLDSPDFCSVLEGRLGLLLLEYPPECAQRRRNHRCSSPVGFGDELLPNFISLTSIQCDKRAKRARFLAKFQNPSNFGNFNFPINSTAIGEAWWDDNSNRIIGAACGILNPSLNLGNSVGDCTMRLSFRLPSVLTMRNDAKIVGEIWSSEGAENPGYFTPIGISSSDGDVSARADCTGQRYEYREVDRVRDSCREKKARKKGKEYPDGKSDEDMRFDLNIRNGGGDNLGSAYMVAVPAENDWYPTLDLPIFDRKSNAGELKMRYKITIYPNYLSSSSNKSEARLDWAEMGSYVLMNAEGVYDSETGQLCLVGCRRKLALNSVSNFVDDCDVAVELEVPPWKERRYVKGIIGSTRPPTDALHFHDLIIESQFKILILI